MKAPTFAPIGATQPRFLPNFDSAGAMLSALANYLQGRDFPGVGMVPRAAAPFAGLVNALPRQARETLYVWSGFAEAIPERRVKDVRGEHFSQWVTRSYPERQYPAVMIGSPSGAIVHLCAALGIPWLPQTFLVPVRRTGVFPDEPLADLEWGREPGRMLAENNPDLQLHQMHDPGQDRLMVERMGFFRMKRLRLGEAFEQFLEERLPRGSTIFISECQRLWPTTQVGERHFFQVGGVGGVLESEYYAGGERVAEYTARYNSPRRSFLTPDPDGDRPEAEWGFEATLRADIERVARERGYRVVRVVYQEADDLSPFVAELYRWWYRQRQIGSSRLSVESFFLLEPYWTLRLGAVPFWMKFNMGESLEKIHAYLDSTEGFDEIYLSVFQHGVDGIGLPPIDEWRTVLERARTHGAFVGMDESKYPRDLAIYARYHEDLRKIPARYPMPGPLALSQLEQFLQDAGQRFPSRFIPHDPRTGEVKGDIWRQPKTPSDELRRMRAERDPERDEPIVSDLLLAAQDGAEAAQR